MRTTTIMILAGVLFTTSASARVARAERKARPPAQTVQRYDFDPDEVEGELLAPDGSSVQSAVRSRWDGLIRVRTTFVPELIKSAEDR
jgi:hypothetical protein